MQIDLKNNNEDMLILVDLDDNEIDYMGKEEAHRLGKLHRAFSIFLVSNNKMLIQKRNRNKYHSGGLWANACCSHPRKGENLTEATMRRMKEELGIECEIKEIFNFIYKTDYKIDLHEYELDHVFLGKYDININNITNETDEYKDFIINKDEIEELKWIDINELKKDIVEHPEKYSSWFIIALPKVLNKL